jgi:GTPase SAR1 family protein
MRKTAEDNHSNGIILCWVCKNVVNTLPVIRAAFEELVEKAGVPCFIFYENNSDDVHRSGMELDLKHVKLARNVV